MKGGAGAGNSPRVRGPGDRARNTRHYIPLVKRMRMMRTPQISADLPATTCRVRVIRVLSNALSQAR
jgi:hypothetical protein